MKVIYVGDSLSSWEKASEKIREEKPFKVAIQAPSRFQPLVDSLISNSITWREFINQVASRTGIENPERSELTAWVHAVRACDLIAARALLIEPDIDEVLQRIREKLTIKEKERIIQEARVWYISRTGFPRRMLSFILSIFFFLPHFLRIWIAKAFMSIYSFIANVIPGDQHDVLVAITLADGLIAREMARRIKEEKPEVVVLHEWYADDVASAYAEL